MGRIIESQDPGGLMALRETLERYWNMTLFVLSFRNTKDDWDSEFRQAFDEGKRASDFVGMVIRLVFTLFATSYFLKEAPSQTSLFYKCAFGATAVSSFGLSMYLSLKIIRIISIYWHRDMAHWKSTYAKVPIFISAAILTFATWMSVWALAWRLAKATHF
jgi:hypothetical protein